MPDSASIKSYDEFLRRYNLKRLKETEEPGASPQEEGAEIATRSLSSV